jgi:type VI secretion system protein ImpK
MNDHFADAVNEVIQGVLEFHDVLRASKVPTVDEARPRFIRLIDGFAKKGNERPSRKVDFDLARAALVYWIDEMLTLHWDWQYAEEFRAVCLELHYTDLKGLTERSPHHHDRAVEGPYLFFELAELAKAREETDALETFLLCVTLGFRGRYDMREQVLTDRVRQFHGHIVPRLRRKEDETAMTGVPLRRLRGQHLLLGVSVLVAVTALVTLIGFIIAVHARPY